MLLSSVKTKEIGDIVVVLSGFLGEDFLILLRVADKAHAIASLSYDLNNLGMLAYQTTEKECSTSGHRGGLASFSDTMYIFFSNVSLQEKSAYFVRGINTLIGLGVQVSLAGDPENIPLESLVYAENSPRVTYTTLEGTGQRVSYPLKGDSWFVIKKEMETHIVGAGVLLPTTLYDQTVSLSTGTYTGMVLENVAYTPTGNYGLVINLPSHRGLVPVFLRRGVRTWSGSVEGIGALGEESE